MSPILTREQVADLLEKYVSRSGGLYDHEKIIYGRFTDPILLELKAEMPDLHEGPHHGSMTQEDANRILLDYAHRLRDTHS